MMIQTIKMVVVAIGAFVLVSAGIVFFLIQTSGAEKSVKKPSPTSSVENVSVKKKSVPEIEKKLINRSGIEEEYETLIFVESAQDNVVFVLNSQGEEIKQISIGSNPHDISASPNRTWVATANVDSGSVSIINVNTLSLNREVKSGKGAHGVAFSPLGDTLAVANRDEGTVSFFSVPGFSELQKVFVGNSPEYVGFSKGGEYAFVTHADKRGGVSILQKQENGFFFQRKIEGIDPHGWAVSPAGDVVFGDMTQNVISFLKTPFFQRNPLPTDILSEFVAFQDETRLWITNINAHSVFIVDADSGETKERIFVGEMPHGVFFSPDKKNAFVPLFRSGEVVFIDTKTRRVTKTVSVGGKLHNGVSVRRRIKL